MPPADDMSRDDSQIALSVIVLTRNRRELLERCLRAVAEQDEPPEEIVVVDTGSTDGTREWLAQRAAEPGPALVVRHWQEGSFAEARNEGVRAARGGLIAMLDDDCEPRPGWAVAIRRGLAEYDALGGLVVPGDESIIPHWWPRELNWLVGLSGPEQFRPNYGNIHYPSTSNLAARREVFESVPFRAVEADFRQGYVYAGGREDAQFWREARLAHFRTFCDPDCVVRHHIPATRFGWRELVRRAVADGRMFWLRERNEDYVQHATAEILTLDMRWLGRVLSADSRGLRSESADAWLNISYWAWLKSTM